MAVEYIQVTFCRIVSQTSNASGTSYNANNYVPPTVNAQGNIINQGQNPPPSNGGSITSNIVIEDIPGDSVIDLYSIKQFNRFYNTQTQNYENNVLELLIDGATTKYIRMNPATLKTYLINLNTP